MMSTIKVYACFTVKFYKNKTPKKFKQGARLARRSWIRLCILRIYWILYKSLASFFSFLFFSFFFGEGGWGWRVGVLFMLLRTV